MAAIRCDSVVGGPTLLPDSDRRFKQATELTREIHRDTRMNRALLVEKALRSA
jgi:hypothetical protein